MLYFIHAFYTTLYLDHNRYPCYSETKLFKNKKQYKNLFNNLNPRNIDVQSIATPVALAQANVLSYTNGSWRYRHSVNRCERSYRKYRCAWLNPVSLISWPCNYQAYSLEPYADLPRLYRSGHLASSGHCLVSARPIFTASGGCRNQDA